jgi:hypothetical protein
MATLIPFLVDAEEVAQVVEDARRDIRYVITDFSAELVISKFKEQAEAEGDIYVPDYQRGLAWPDDKKSYFIESLLLRVPIPPVFFYEVEGRLEIVDGSQRIRTLVAFANDKFSLSGLEKLDLLNGFEFSKLPVAVQRRLFNTPIRSYVLDQGTDEGTRVDVFRRLNTSGKKLQDAEIRKGAFRGPFLDLVIECAASKLFLDVIPHIGGRSDSQSERQELVTRFFIYADRYMDFRHDVRKFLDARMVEFNKTLAPADLARMRGEFQSVMQFVHKRLPNAFYRTEKGKLVPRVRFEAIAVGTALALRQDPNPPQLADLNWLRSIEFEQLVRTDASNSAPKLRARIEFVRDHLLGN